MQPKLIAKRMSLIEDKHAAAIQKLRQRCLEVLHATPEAGEATIKLLDEQIKGMAEGEASLVGEIAISRVEYMKCKSYDPLIVQSSWRKCLCFRLCEGQLERNRARPEVIVEYFTLEQRISDAKKLQPFWSEDAREEVARSVAAVNGDLADLHRLIGALLAGLDSMERK